MYQGVVVVSDSGETVLITFSTLFGGVYVITVETFDGAREPITFIIPVDALKQIGGYDGAIS